MTDAQQELGELARLVAGLVEWDLEDGAFGYPTPMSKLQAEASPTRPDVAPTRPDASVAKEEPAKDVSCRLCSLGQEFIVFGEGDPQAELVFVGGYPDLQDDQQGRPFIGRAGELLDKMIQAMGVSRERVYVCNVMTPNAANSGSPIETHIVALQPKVVVALGHYAAQTLLKTTDAFENLRGSFHPFFDTQLMPTHHPADLLRNPADKRMSWSDLQQVMSVLGLSK